MLGVDFKPFLNDFQAHKHIQIHEILNPISDHIF